MISAGNQTTVLKTKGERTRHAILTRAAELATQEGLEPLSIGRLADAAQLSKSGLFAHFGSKEELQLATVDHAAALFREEVIDPAREAPKGLPRVWALCDRMNDYAERQVFPGGCFFAATASEYNNRPGPVRDRIVEMLRSWLSYLEHAVEQAQAAGELDPTVDPHEIAFQLDAFAQSANANFQLFKDDRIFDDARRAIRERLESLRPSPTSRAEAA
ncbi:MAG: TetR family transcriptional regulator C-terminal domain-containing protein [Gaiellaceae bacterium]